MSRASTIRVLVKGTRGDTLGLDMSPQDRIADVIVAVAERDGIPPRLQCLMVGGMLLRADRPLADCTLASGVVHHTRAPRRPECARGMTLNPDVLCQTSFWRKGTVAKGRD